METSLGIHLLLVGFSAATCCIFLSDAFGRRVFMGIAIACGVGVVFMHLMGPYRVLLMAFIAYLAHDWRRERRAAASVEEVPAQPSEAVESTARASDRRR